MEILLSPERRSNVVKFAKNDRHDALILLPRDEQFLFFPLKMIQRGDHRMIFSHFLAWWNPSILLVFYLSITSPPLTRIIQPDNIVLFVYTDIFLPCSCIMSANLIFSSYPAFCLLFVMLALFMVLMLFLSFLWRVFYPYTIVQLGPNLSWGLGPKVNTKLTQEPPPPPTENFKKASRQSRRPKFGM